MKKDSYRAVRPTDGGLILFILIFIHVRENFAETCSKNSERNPNDIILGENKYMDQTLTRQGRILAGGMLHLVLDIVNWLLLISIVV